MRPEGKPFRWNMSNPNLMARLKFKPDEMQVLPEYQQDRMLRCGASALRVGDFDFVFVGRSLESVFDILSGSLARTSWYDRLQQLQISIRGNESLDAIREEISKRHERLYSITRRPKPDPEDQIDVFRKYLLHSRLTPAQILERPRDVVFVDIVAKGTTFGTLLDLMQSCEEDQDVWESAKRRFHWVAVQPEPETFIEPLWKPQDSEWTSTIDAGRIHQLTMNANLWCYLGDMQFKTTHVYSPTLWGKNGEPAEFDWNLYAARGAREYYRRGERSRRRLAALLGEAPEPVDAIKQLVKELRREERNW